MVNKTSKIVPLLIFVLRTRLVPLVTLSVLALARALRELPRAFAHVCNGLTLVDVLLTAIILLLVLVLAVVTVAVILVAPGATLIAINTCVITSDILLIVMVIGLRVVTVVIAVVIMLTLQS